MANRTRLTVGCMVFLSSIASRFPCHAQDTASVELRGRVMTPSEAPLPGTELTVLGLSRTVLSDSGGRFVLRGLPPGEYVVRVRRIGFRAQQLSVRLEAGTSSDVTIVLEPGAYELPEVEVSARFAKPIEYAYTHKYDDFFWRRRVGLGHYLTRNDIAKRSPVHTPDLLSRIPRVTVYWRGADNVDVGIGGCIRIGVWIDGWKQRNPDLYRRHKGLADSVRIAVGNMLQRVLPSEIEMMEVYRGPAEMPGEFSGEDCAAIVIWRR